MLKSTNKKDKNGQEIFENDILYNPLSERKYTVKYGEFIIDYTKPFSINCLGFYVEYTINKKIYIDSFSMLDLNNLQKI